MDAMLISLAPVVILTGMTILIGASIWARFGIQLPERQLVFIVAALFVYALFVAPLLVYLLRGTFPWIAPVSEEILKLAVVSRLLPMRSAVPACLAFGGIELADKGFAFLFTAPLPPQLIAGWMILALSPVLMHTATGVLYASREGRAGPIWIGCVLIHFAHNLIISAISEVRISLAAVVFVLMLGLGELLAAIAISGWLQDRRRTNGAGTEEGSQTLAGDPPIV